MQGAVGVSVTAAGQSVTSSLPEEVGTGATPQSAAKDGSLPVLGVAEVELSAAACVACAWFFR
jgi:hypothetical protein